MTKLSAAFQDAVWKIERYSAQAPSAPPGDARLGSTAEPIAGTGVDRVFARKVSKKVRIQNFGQVRSLALHSTSWCCGFGWPTMRDCPKALDRYWLSFPLSV